MLNIKKHYNNLSIKTKLFFSYIILILIPISVGGVLINYNFFDLFRDNSSMLITQRLDEELINIDRKLTNIEMAGYHISSNTNLLTFLATQYTDYDYGFFDNLSTRIYPMLSLIKSMNPDIKNTNLFTFNKTLPDANIFRHAKNYENQDWFKSVIMNTRIGKPYWEKYHRERNYTESINPIENTNDVYSLFYIINPISNTGTTYLELVINPKLLLESVNKSTLGNNGYFAVLDADGHIISERNTPLLSALSANEDFSKSLAQSSSNYKFSWDNIQYDINYRKIERLNAYLLSIVPVTEVTALFEAPRKKYIISIFITFIVLLILAYYLESFFTKKINRISNAIYKFQSGDFDTTISVNGADELDKLSMDFNRMSEKINELVNTVYKAEIAQKQDQIFALQAQINPHFIYNTLESLKMMAELHDEEAISDGLTALGNLLRQNNSIGDHLISINEELENLSDYIKIQNLTYNNKININFDIPENILDHKILRLVLQPLVENSIIHGLCEPGSYIDVFISGIITGQDIILTVKDDGNGIDEAKLIYLNKVLNSGSIDEKYKQAKKGIGIINVNRRIKLYFGSEYGISINSITGTGTAITIKIPATL